MVDLARFMTLSDIAGWLRLSWDTVKAVVKGRLEKDYRRIGYRRVRQIAIDELYLGRTRKYVTLVMDMDSARIIWVGEGRGAEALREFWRRFKLSGARLKAVAMDMSGAYAASVRAHAPHAILTFDRFHVMKLMNERLDDLRRELARETQDRRAKEAIKGLRWLLLHRRDNLEKDAAKRLERSLEINQPLQCAYLIKRNWANFGSRTMGVKPGPSCANGPRKPPPAESVNSRPWQKPSSATPRESELLPHRFDQRKDGRNQSQDSRSARQRLWLSRRRFSQIAPLRSS